MSNTGHITLIYGCMFSGKTTELIRRLDGLGPGEFAAFKHAIDRRYRADAIVSHGGLTVPAQVVTEATDIRTRLSPEVRVVAMDEAHFFGEALVAVIRELANAGKRVIVTALEPDSWGRPFRVVATLKQMTDDVIFRTATCARCGATADRTQRLTPIVQGQLVGGAESYEPRCAHCWAPPPESPPGSQRIARASNTGPSVQQRR